jgi:predicted amidohydrolase
MSLRIAGAQIPVSHDIAVNTANLLRAVQFAADQKADLLLTPEGSLSGYTWEFDPQAAQQALQKVTQAARALRVGLALGTCYIEADGLCYNEVRFYLPDGGYLGFHSKVLRCGTLSTPSQGEIEHFAESPLRTFDFLGLRVGALICNDLWANPQCTPMPDSHLTQQLAGLGARLILHAVNGGRDGSAWSQVAWQYHEANLRMRAQAGNVWVITVDNCAPLDLPCSAPCGVIDPQGDWVCRTEPVGEQFFTYTIPGE